MKNSKIPFGSVTVLKKIVLVILPKCYLSKFFHNGYFEKKKHVVG